MARTYSTLLMIGNVLVAGGGGAYNANRTVPAGHTWVVRYISVTADATYAIGWRTWVLGPAIGLAGASVVVPFAGGLAGAALMSSEWEGRCVVPSGYTLRFQSMAELGLNSGTGYALISGYDLVD